MKPFSESCEQNRQPILGALKAELTGKKSLLEIGSGTGQHAVYFSPEFPDICWQTSDMENAHAGIQMWLDEHKLANVLPPIALNVSKDSWPDQTFDAVYSANTVHIMSWEDVENLFQGIGKCLDEKGVFCLYGPFNYNGMYTSISNERFDDWLKSRDPSSGIKDFEAINKLAKNAHLILKKDYTMPANNRVLVWVKKV